MQTAWVHPVHTLWLVVQPLSSYIENLSEQLTCCAWHSATIAVYRQNCQESGNCSLWVSQQSGLLWESQGIPRGLLVFSLHLEEAGSFHTSKGLCSNRKHELPSVRASRPKAKACFFYVPLCKLLLEGVAQSWGWFFPHQMIQSRKSFTDTPSCSGSSQIDSNGQTSQAHHPLNNMFNCQIKAITQS